MMGGIICTEILGKIAENTLYGGGVMLWGSFVTSTQKVTSAS
jgi:hypothetical protein